MYFTHVSMYSVCLRMSVYKVWGWYRVILPNIGEEREQEQQTGQDVSPAHDTRHLQHTQIVEITRVSDSSGEETLLDVHMKLIMLLRYSEMHNLTCCTSLSLRSLPVRNVWLHQNLREELCDYGLDRCPLSHPTMSFKALL